MAVHVADATDAPPDGDRVRVAVGALAVQEVHVADATDAPPDGQAARQVAPDPTAMVASCPTNVPGHSSLLLPTLDTDPSVLGRAVGLVATLVVGPAAFYGIYIAAIPVPDGVIHAPSRVPRPGDTALPRPVETTAGGLATAARDEAGILALEGKMDQVPGEVVATCVPAGVAEVRLHTANAAVATVAVEAFRADGRVAPAASERPPAFALDPVPMETTVVHLPPRLAGTQALTKVAGAATLRPPNEVRLVVEAVEAATARPATVPVVLRLPGPVGAVAVAVPPTGVLPRPRQVDVLPVGLAAVVVGVARACRGLDPSHVAVEAVLGDQAARAGIHLLPRAAGAPMAARRDVAIVVPPRRDEVPDEAEAARPTPHVALLAADEEDGVGDDVTHATPRRPANAGRVGVEVVDIRARHAVGADRPAARAKVHAPAAVVPVVGPYQSTTPAIPGHPVDAVGLGAGRHLGRLRGASPVVHVVAPTHAEGRDPHPLPAARGDPPPRLGGVPNATPAGQALAVPVGPVLPLQAGRVLDRPGAATTVVEVGLDVAEGVGGAGTTPYRPPIRHVGADVGADVLGALADALAEATRDTTLVLPVPSEEAAPDDAIPVPDVRVVALVPFRPTYDAVAVLEGAETVGHVDLHRVLGQREVPRAHGAAGPRRPSEILTTMAALDMGPARRPPTTGVVGLRRALLAVVEGRLDAVAFGRSPRATVDTNPQAIPGAEVP